MNSNKTELLINSAQKVIDEFSERLTMPVGIFSSHENGNLFSYSTSFQAFCRAVCETQFGNQLCATSHINVAKASIDGRRPIVYRCHCGLTNVVAPIVDQTSCIGAVFSGQFREDTISASEQQWLQTRVADLIGLPRETILQLFFKTPQKNRLDVRELQNSLINLASKISAVANVPPHIMIYEVVQLVEELTPELIAHLQKKEDDLWKVPWNVFEHLIAEFLTSRGFSQVKLVGRSDQTAADIFAVEQCSSTGVALRYFIEVKRTKQKVGIEVVDHVYGAMVRERPNWGWHVAMICSLSGFKQFRNNKMLDLRLAGVELRGPEYILTWLREYRLSGKGLWLPKDIALEPFPPSKDKSVDNSIN